MEKTTEEKARAKLLKFGKKNRWNRAVAVPLLFFVMLFFHVCNYCKNNGKRFAVMAGTFFLFAVYSSFSFPAFITEDAGNDYELKNAETADISFFNFWVILMPFRESMVNVRSSPVLSPFTTY